MWRVSSTNFLTQLLDEITWTRGFLTNQFGFRKGRQGTDAINKFIKTNHSWVHCRLCVLITIDVINVFNSASWERMLHVMEERKIYKKLLKIIASYLSNMRITVHAAEQQMTKEINREVPWCSILRPVLWNVLYDELLEPVLSKGVTLIGFAEEAVINNTNSVVNCLSERIDSNHLELAQEKTETVLLTTNWIIWHLEFQIQVTTTEPKRASKYLGVWLDTKLTFGNKLGMLEESRLMLDTFFKSTFFWRKKTFFKYYSLLERLYYFDDNT